MKVLIVDDEPIILSGLVTIVKQVAPIGTEIRSSLNAFEGLKVMKDYLPDVTITDINMPEKNGFQLIRDARTEGLCDRFIILTGYNEFEYVRQALRFGVVDYLLKPLDQSEIASLLTRVNDELPSEDDSEYTRHTEYILAYLQKNYEEALSLDQLADRMNLHPNYISSLFKKETGDTFIHYLNSLRICEAKRLLKMQRNLTISAIGHEVGYDSTNYFIKVFKKYTGTTPGTFRENGQNSINEKEELY